MRSVAIGALIAASIQLHRGAPERWIATQDLVLNDDRGADYSFAFINGMTLGPHDEMAVRRFDDRAVDIFDSTGARLRKFGRRGKGPGEFGNVSAIDWMESGLWVRDDNLRRLTVFSPSGEVQTVTQLTTPRGTEPLTARRPMVGGGWVAAQEPAESSRNDDRIVLTDSAGTVVKDFGRLIAAPTDIPLGGMNSLGYQPFEDRSLWRVIPGGRGLVIIDRKAIKGHPQFRVRRFSASGALQFDRSYQHSPVPISRHDVDSAVAVADYKFHNEAAPKGVAIPGWPTDVSKSALRAGLYVPPYRPAVTGVAAGRDGTIWIRREDGQRDVTWQALDQRGDIVGEVSLPGNVSIYVGEMDRMWGVRRVEFDLQEIVRYRIQRR